ncbi:MAG: DUF4124 domain-containing protein [Betaproteobacteria bacterium]
MKRSAMAIHAVGALLVLSLPAAQAQIFVCVDDKGNKTYQNTGETKGCKKLDVPPIVTVPATKAAPRAATPPPTNFPRVDGGAQKARDEDRRKILEDELRTERTKLDSLRAEYNNGEPERRGDERNYARYLERVERLREDIQRAEANVRSLERELARP